MHSLSPTTDAPREALFSLGWAILTLGAISAFERTGERISQYLARHQSGDYGHLCAEDCQVNRRAITAGLSIRSEYTLPDNTPILVITDSDRHHTRVLLTSEY